MLKNKLDSLLKHNVDVPDEELALDEWDIYNEDEYIPVETYKEAILKRIKRYKVFKELSNNEKATFKIIKPSGDLFYIRGEAVSPEDYHKHIQQLIDEYRTS